MQKAYTHLQTRLKLYKMLLPLQTYKSKKVTWDYYYSRVLPNIHQLWCSLYINYYRKTLSGSAYGKGTVLAHKYSRKIKQLCPLSIDQSYSQIEKIWIILFLPTWTSFELILTALFHQHMRLACAKILHVRIFFITLNPNIASGYN